MEKRKPTYNLDEIKQSFSSLSKLRMTRSARLGALKLGLRDGDVVEVIQKLCNRDFHKSMTTYADYLVWQDVYYGRFGELVVYVKFMREAEGHLIVSFKEK